MDISITFSVVGRMCLCLPKEQIPTSTGHRVNRTSRGVGSVGVAFDLPMASNNLYVGKWTVVQYVAATCRKATGGVSRRILLYVGYVSGTKVRASALRASRGGFVPSGGSVLRLSRRDFEGSAMQVGVADVSGSLCGSCWTESDSG